MNARLSVLAVSALAVMAECAVAFPGRFDHSFTHLEHIELGGSPFLIVSKNSMELDIQQVRMIKSFSSIELLGLQHQFPAT